MPSLSPLSPVSVIPNPLFLFPEPLSLTPEPFFCHPEPLFFQPEPFICHRERSLRSSDTALVLSFLLSLPMS